MSETAGIIENVHMQWAISKTAVKNYYFFIVLCQRFASCQDIFLIQDDHNLSSPPPSSLQPSSYQAQCDRKVHTPNEITELYWIAFSSWYCQVSTDS